MVIGFSLIVLSNTMAGIVFGKEAVLPVIAMATFSWMVSVFLADKYVHKYAQRYLTYLVSSHLKAALIMGLFLWVMGKFADLPPRFSNLLWAGYISFILSDFFVSVLRSREFPGKQPSEVIKSIFEDGIYEERPSKLSYTDPTLTEADKKVILGQIGTEVDNSLVEFIGANLVDLTGGNRSALVIDDITTSEDQCKPTPVGLLVGRIRINDVKQLNQFLRSSVELIISGGYFAGRYMPLENVARNLKKRYPGLLYRPIFILHFIWYRAIPKIPWLDTLYFSPIFSWLDNLWFALTKRRNRVLSKAEVWGRLSYYGMRVIAESEGDGERYFIAQRVAIPVQGKKPSYYPIVSLEKVGLDGKSIYAHKIRTMYPYSEFLQKRIFEDHGLARTGKFANDFRLTEYGPFLRKYWLDELPQIFDWLRGEVKLVGMRVTTRQFLSLYPKELVELYVQIKPGLIPPIFGEGTKGFEQIVEVELTYLRSYWEQPIRTDVRYLIRTFTDIVFKGIRSR